jgi:hypothetical protein
MFNTRQKILIAAFSGVFIAQGVLARELFRTVSDLELTAQALAKVAVDHYDSLDETQLRVLHTLGMKKPK